MLNQEEMLILKQMEELEQLRNKYINESIKVDKFKEVLDKIKEIFKDYGVKEDIVTYSNYNITGEEVYTILELLEKIDL